ncbi:MAG: GTPase ObgE [Actinomycetota bacterium]
MAFIDEAKVKVMAGGGGNGSSAFQRQPFQPKGGPDGGDGGNGGSITLRADTSVGTLLDVKNHPHVKADRGGHGSSKRQHGATGADKLILVPPGTVVFNEDDVLIADLAGPGDEVVIAKGGRGGRGNVHFATATRRAPTFAEKGEPGEDRTVRLELRLLADVGLVGFPNAGKSTLISRISAAKPKIANYPFTTLTPNLGVVKHGESSFVVADIPGLVPGASDGKGLGHRFLRHVRRAAVLLFLVDLSAEDRDPLEDVATLRAELAAFDPTLAERPSYITVTKIDVTTEGLDAMRERYGAEVMAISAVTGDGIPEIVRRLAAGVQQARDSAPPPAGYLRHIVPDDPITIAREGQAWRVGGRRAERAVETTDMSNDEAIERLQRRLIRMGVERDLESAGAKRGDEVRIGEMEFDFQPDLTEAEAEALAEEEREARGAHEPT